MFPIFWGFEDPFGVDRSGWRDKSDAALRRENDAIRRFDAFLERSKSSPSFPVTEEVVPAGLHLTDACWRTFKQYVVATGCTTKRREATPDERNQAKNKRNGKMYVISVTVPVHPDQAKEVAEQKKQKAAAAAEAKRQRAAASAEKKRIGAERKAAEERELQAKVEEEYEAVESSMKKESKVLKDRNLNDAVEASPNKKAKITEITVPREAILQHAERVHISRLHEIDMDIEHQEIEERQKLLSELKERMEAKKTARKQEAREYCDSIKKRIVDMTET